MTIIYTWSIPSSGLLTMNIAGETDGVVSAQYNLTGTDGTYTFIYEGATQFTYSSGSPFVPFDQLTEAQVIGWVQNALGQVAISNMEKTIDKQIERMANPPPQPQPTPAPWSKT